MSTKWTEAFADVRTQSQPMACPLCRTPWWLLPPLPTEPVLLSLFEERLSHLQIYLDKAERESSKPWLRSRTTFKSCGNGWTD